MAWRGDPSWPPSVAFGDDSEDTIYVSWNGATEVQAWELQQAEQESALDEEWENVSPTQKTGFEIRVDISLARLRFLRLVALAVSATASNMT